MKIKDIKNKISGVGIAAFVAILALLFVTIDQKSDINGLQAELENAEVGISGVEAEYLNTIAEFEGSVKVYELEIASIEDDLAAINGRLQVSDNDRVTAEAVAAELADQLFTVKAALVELQENPNCPVTQ